MSIYYSNKDVNGANCRSYFSALGAADFSVTSSVLNKDSLLFSKARTCLVSAIKLRLAMGLLREIGNIHITLIAKTKNMKCNFNHHCMASVKKYVHVYLYTSIYAKVAHYYCKQYK